MQTVNPSNVAVTVGLPAKGAATAVAFAPIRTFVRFHVFANYPRLVATVMVAQFEM